MFVIVGDVLLVCCSRLSSNISAFNPGIFAWLTAIHLCAVLCVCHLPLKKTAGGQSKRLAQIVGVYIMDSPRHTGHYRRSHCLMGQSITSSGSCTDSMF